MNSVRATGADKIRTDLARRPLAKRKRPFLGVSTCFSSLRPSVPPWRLVSPSRRARVQRGAHLSAIPIEGTKASCWSPHHHQIGKPVRSGSNDSDPAYVELLRRGWRDIEDYISDRVGKRAIDAVGTTEA